MHVYNSNKTLRETVIVICMSNGVSIPVLLCVIDAAGVFVALFCIFLAAEDRILSVVQLFLDVIVYILYWKLVENLVPDKLRLIVALQQTYNATSVVGFTTNDSCD